MTTYRIMVWSRYTGKFQLYAYYPSYYAKNAAFEKITTNIAGGEWWVGLPDAIRIDMNLGRFMGWHTISTHYRSHGECYIEREE